MITLKEVMLPSGARKTFSFSFGQKKEVMGENLLALPAMIDPHVHFRTPGFEYKENWKSAAKAALKGGVTTVCDMPNTNPASITQERLIQKKALIDKQLKQVGIPLRYALYFGSDKKHFNELHKINSEVCGLKIFMGSSTGELLMDDDKSLHMAFEMAAKLNLLVAVHAEDENMIQANKKQYEGHEDFSTHSLIRTPDVAASAIKKAIDLVRLYGTRLYVLHVSSEVEIDLIRQAKKEGLPVFAETCPHYLFLSTDDYDRLQGFAQMNPALRQKIETEKLWQAVNEGVIDTIGSDHAPHTMEEKKQAYGCCPSGVPGIETTLPLLYTAYTQGKLSLTKLIELTHEHPRSLLHFSENDDLVFIDTKTIRKVENKMLCTKVKWSPYIGMELVGWPVFTVLRGECYELNKLHPSSHD